MIEYREQNHLRRPNAAACALHREGAARAIGDYSSPSSSTSNTNVAFGGITPPAPRAP